MSHLGITIARILEANRKTQKDLAEASGVTRPVISRLISGDQQDMTDENFASLLASITRDQRERAEIIKARCEDARVGPGSELVEISIKGKKEAKEEGAFGFGEQVKLPYEDERALAFLRSQIPLNPALSDMVRSHARLLGLK